MHDRCRVPPMQKATLKGRAMLLTLGRGCGGGSPQGQLHQTPARGSWSVDITPTSPTPHAQFISGVPSMEESSRLDLN
jgi:hypothetical protein